MLEKKSFLKNMVIAMVDSNSPEAQYMTLAHRVLSGGTWVPNTRTGKRCLTVINADLEYDCRKHELPVLTSKETAYEPAMAEILGYLRGYTTASEFEALGTKSWNKNANAEVWLNNPFCKGPGHMGYCYGEVGRRYRMAWEDGDDFSHSVFDQWESLIDNLLSGEDNRRLHVTFDHPGAENLGCLPACMHSHWFSILGGTLYLTSYQRSADIPLGLPFNMIQVAWLLITMAKITNLKPGIAYHKIVNAHIYEDQISGMCKQIDRSTYETPTLVIHPKIKSWGDLMDEKTGIDAFHVSGYESQEAINFPFSV